MSGTTTNLHEKLAQRKIRRPSAAIYLPIGLVWIALFKRKLRVNIKRNVDLRAFRYSPYIVLSNHNSRLDYMFAGMACFPERLNYVAAHNEFFRSHLALMMRILQAIPKKNFYPDRYTFKEIGRLLKGNGKVIIFPSGHASISGIESPSIEGVGAMVKHFKVPVFYTKIRGGYMTAPRYCLDTRTGRVDVTLDKLFIPEDLEKMTADEIEAKIASTLYHDEYAWNKTARVSYKCKGERAHNLHQLLYWCPRCGSEFTMQGAGDSITCRKCGNGATLNDFYDLIPFDSTCVIPETPSAWYEAQRARVRAELLEGRLELRERVSLGTVPKDRYVKNLAVTLPVGEGELSYSSEGLRFEGTREGQPYSVHLPPAQVPTLIFPSDMHSMHLYYKGDFHEFIPRSESTAKWLLATQEGWGIDREKAQAGK